MGRNVEIKARVRDLSVLRGRVESLADGPGEVLDQEDVFFHAPKGRVKLRTFPGGGGELIAYDRPDEAGASLSEFHIHRTDNPVGLKSFLSDVLGVRGVVRKRRLLYRIGQTRVHLDEVDGLGAFLELETVLTDTQSEEEGVRIANGVLARLEIPDEDRIDCAYIDLLEGVDG
jgi:predicted adenylyl cyclase CyaB